jgi:hypothetical protein
MDHRTGEIVPLFHPRRDVWEDHFAFRGPLIEGLTAIGRATVRVLRMNEGERLERRTELWEKGEL